MHFILKMMWTWHRCFIHWGCWTVVHLAVGINYRSQQLPGACSAVHPQHAQDLQEPQAPDGRGGKNVALRSSCQHRHWGNQHHDVCGLEGKNCTQYFWIYCHHSKITVNLIHVRHLFTHLWHKKASGRISASPSTLCIGSSSRQTISARCTPPQRPRWSQFPASQTTAVKLTTYPEHAECRARLYMQK